MIIDWVKRGWIPQRNAQAILRAAAVWLDPSDLTSMWQSTNGTGAHPGANDPVGAVLNKGSAGGLAAAPSGSARPTLRNSGALWWIEFDGVDDALVFDQVPNLFGDYTIIAAFTPLSAQSYVLGGTTTSDNQNLIFGRRDVTNNYTIAHYVNDLDATYNPASVAILTAARSNNRRRLRGGGVQITQDAADTAALTSWGGAGIGRFVSFFQRLNLFGLCIASTDIGDTNIAIIETYFATKAGIAL